MPSRFMISAMASPTFMDASLPPVSSTGGNGAVLRGRATFPLREA